MNLDLTSIGGCGATIYLGFISMASKSEFMFWLGVIVALSTLMYNVIRIAKAIKKRKTKE